MNLALGPSLSVRECLFIAVRNPDVHCAGDSQLFCKILGNADAGFSMLNPEITNFIDRAGKGQAVHYLAVEKKVGLEIKADSFFLRKINPFF